MRTISVTVGPLVTAANNNIAVSQTQTVAGALILNGTLGTGTTLVLTGVATLDTPRRIIIHDSGADTGVTWTVIGTNWAGNTITEALTGTSGSNVTSVLDYATVTSIASNVAAAGAVYVGTTTTACSPWVRFDEWAPAPISAQFTVTGTINYTLQTSFDDPNDLVNAVAPASMDWDSTISPVVGASASTSAAFAISPVWARILLNSGSGSVKGAFAQFSQVPSV